MRASKIFRLNWFDVLKGGIMAALASSLTALQMALDSGVIHWKTVAMAGVSGFLGYLIKNFFTSTPKDASAQN